MKALVVEYFKHPNESRHEELVDCMQSNIDSGLFDHVIVFHEDDKPTELKGDDIVFVKHKRTTFADRFSFCNDYFDNGVICVIANSDILFDKSILKVDSITKDQLLCITRIESNGTYTTNEGSQDVWVGKTPFKKELIQHTNFELGRWACDGRLIAVAEDAGYDLSNPAYIIFCKHKHEGWRNMSNRTSIYHKAVKGKMGSLTKTNFI